MAPLIDEKRFTLKTGDRLFRIPHIKNASVRVFADDKGVDQLTDSSIQSLSDYFTGLANSRVNKGGIALVCGTYDNLHYAHEAFLKIAASVCDELYIGVEDQEVAFERKERKHPILPNADRLAVISNLELTADANVFIRSTALDEIKALKKAGKEISTLVVSEQQNDSFEMLEAMHYCYKNGIQVAAVSDLKAENRYKKMSSTDLHESGLALKAS